MKRESSKRKKHESKENQQTKVKLASVSLTGIFDQISSSKAVLLLGIFIVFIGLFSFYNYLLTNNLFFFKDIGSDSVNQNYPAIIHISNVLDEQLTTKWSFYAGMGSPYVISFPHEPIGIIRLIETKVGMMLWGDNYLVYSRFIRIFIYFFLTTGLLFFFYLRTLSFSKYPSFIGALLVSFSGYMVVGSGWGFADHAFKAVLLLFAFEQLFVKNRWYFFPFAVLYLGGNPFVLFIYSFFLLVYSVFRFSQQNSKFVGYIKLAGQMVFLGIAGLLMNLDNIFNSYLAMFNSPRVAGNASYSQYLTEGVNITNQFNLGATTVLRTFSSDILGTGSNFKGWNNYLEAPLFYIGLLTLLLLPQIFVYLNKRKKIVFGAFLGFWLLTLFFPYLRYSILAFTGDYFRYGFDFFIPFTFLFYAIYSLNKMDEGFKVNYKLLGATLFLLLVLLFFPYKSIKISIINNQLRMILVIFLFAYCGLLILFSYEKYKNYAQIGILLLVVVELSFSSYKSYEERVPVTKEEFKIDKAGYADGTMKAVNFIKSKDHKAFYRTSKDYSSGNSEHTSLNDALAQSYYGTTSYSSFNQLNYIRFLEETGVIEKGNETMTRWAPGFKGYPLLQTIGSIKYHLSKSENPPFKHFGFDSIAIVDSVKILKNRYYLPFGFTYDKYINFDDFQKLSLFNKRIALLNGFVYENDKYTFFNPEDYSKLNILDSSIFVSEKGFNFELYQQFTDGLRKDTFIISSFMQDNIIGSIKLNKSKVLFFSIPYDEGWKIKVDGDEKSLSRVNIGFTGINLPAGEHEIELSFTPKYYILTSWISWTSVVLFWLYLGYYFVRKKKTKPKNLVA